MHTTRGDGIASLKQRRRNLSGDGVRNLATVSGCGTYRGSRIIYVATTSGLQSDAAKPSFIFTYDCMKLRRISLRSIDSFQVLTPKAPSLWYRSLAPSLNFFDHVIPVKRRTVDQPADGKLRDKNAKESWALLEYLALYDNESWKDPRDFAKSVKVISLPQDVPSTSDRRLIELKNQVQCLMEAHFAPMQPTQVNKITSSCEICSLTMKP
nr:MAK10-like protein [Tanacetum cinerariifolium]